jgi:hypothetical protein
MGFIKKIIGGIFALLGGILKLVGIGKKGEFYMELDEADTSASEAANPPTTESSGTAPEPQPAMASQAAAPTSQDTQPVPEPRVISQNTASGNPVQSKPVVEVKSTVSEVTNFATDYLVNPRTNGVPRRRPGPSVAPFKNMVREMSKKSPSMG